MTTYNTGNPIGSKDPRDLYDNAENLDEAVNTRTAESWDDRFGVPRKTWWGMEQDFQQFLINSGYMNIGDYGPGLEITARNQIFWRDGELYRAGANLELPYTTTGDWGTEEGLFVAVGDQAIRQELGSTNDGSYIIANASVVVESVAALQNISIPASQLSEKNQLFRVLDYHGGWTAEGRSPRGGGDFRYDFTSTADIDGGVIVSGPGGIGRFIRIITDHVNPDFWGALGNGVTNDTVAIQSAVHFYPINETDIGIITPRGFANGGNVRLTRGRYPVYETITLRRGLRFTGESKESTQIVSFCLSSVLQYRDMGRYHPDELYFEHFSIWQDPSVIPTGGAGIDLIDSTFVTPNALAQQIVNVTVEGTYRGIRYGAGIGVSVRDSLISKCVSHGIEIQGNISTTSCTFESVYSQQCGGNGFNVLRAAYISFVSTASDSHGTNGYYVQDATTVSFVSAGAEENATDGIALVRVNAVNGHVYMLKNRNGIYQEDCRYVHLTGYLNGERPGTYGLSISNPLGPVIDSGLYYTGVYASNRYNSTNFLTRVAGDGGDLFVNSGIIRFANESTGQFIRVVAFNPETSISGPPGSLALRTDTGQLYVKQTGTGNTGWRAVQLT